MCANRMHGCAGKREEQYIKVRSLKCERGGITMSLSFFTLLQSLYTVIFFKYRKMSKRKLEISRLGHWYDQTVNKRARQNAEDRITKIIAPRNSVTGAKKRDEVMDRVTKKIGKHPLSGGYIVNPASGRSVGTIPTDKRHSKNHPGFKKVAQRIAKKEHIPIARANAILATSTRKRLTGGTTLGDYMPKLGDLSGDQGYKFSGGKWYKNSFAGLKEVPESAVPVSYRQQAGRPVLPMLNKLPQMDFIPKSQGSGVHLSIPDMKLNPELAKAAQMISNGSPLDKDNEISEVSDKRARQEQVMKDHVPRFKVGKRVKVTALRRPHNFGRHKKEGGRTFTSLKNIYVTPAAAP